MLSLGGELTVAIKNGLRKSAKEVIEYEDELRKTANKADEVKQMDELIEHLDKIAGMAENIKTTKDVKKFLASAEKLAKINPGEVLKYLDEALQHFNHKVIGNQVVQISDTNCSLLVQKVDEFLKTGKISKAEHCEPIDVFEISQKYQKPFLTSTIPSLRNTMKEGERGIMYGNRGAQRIGHVFNVIKINGELKFIDGQSGGLADLNKGYISFKYLKTN